MRAIDCVISRYLFKHKDDRIWRNGQIAIPRWTRNQWYVAILLSAMTRRGWKVTIGSRRLYRPKKKTRRRKYRPKNKSYAASSWYVGFTHHEVTTEHRFGQNYARAKTLPLATCLAVLKAFGVELCVSESNQIVDMNSNTVVRLSGNQECDE